MTILMTGGSGKLGSMILKLRPGIIAPSHQEMDITDPSSISMWRNKISPAIVIHLAGLTDLVYCEKNKAEAWKVNVIGTRNVCDMLTYTYIAFPSTDYVFYEDGPHREEDHLDPCNYYSFTKAIAEYVVRQRRSHLIVRGTFKESGEWHKYAPTDMLQSFMYTADFADSILKLIDGHIVGTVHLKGEDKFVFDFAKLQRKNVKPCLRSDIPLPLPKDCRLDATKYKEVLQ